MEYEKLLLEGRKRLPKEVSKKERFEVPKVKGHIQGNTTVINNFHQIVQDLGRSKEQVLKFLLKELATPGDVTKSALILRRKVSASSVNEKMQKYAKKFVICVMCGKPDTKVMKEGGVSFVKCMACGSKNPVKGA
ncbi:translation initiation factor IF-2 subunit beta [Candidatus Woesearchaeota archaeon]|jgi:translation initiation factor 2 subunit 2|nr:translation initiation factor IF-2 subunit beta [Candidatus Woesearchaeota archaeon]